MAGVTLAGGKLRVPVPPPVAVTGRRELSVQPAARAERVDVASGLRAYGAAGAAFAGGAGEPGGVGACAHRPVAQKRAAYALARQKKRLYSDLGEMLFTHFGVSGPLVLSASAHLTGLPAQGEEVELVLDLKPGLTDAQLDARILRDVAAAPKKQLGHVLCGLFPARLAETVARLCRLDPLKPAERAGDARGAAA